jgi:hypothetical protein
MRFPETLIEAVRQFSDLDHATEFFARLRWPQGVRCPHCGSDQVDYVTGRRVWECRGKHPKSQFSVKMGTIFEECRLPIDKCLIAIWLEVNAKNSISSYEVARHLGVTQKTACFLQHRVRHALHVGSFDTKLAGIVEADETFVGGRAIFMHKAQRKAKIKKTGGNHMTPVMGLLQRHSGDKHSMIRATVLPTRRQPELHDVIRKNVEPGTHLYTDAMIAYRSLNDTFVHKFIDHAEKYVEGAVHTNGLENFWALFKRCIKGTHVSIEPFHLAAYVDAEAYRFNNRQTDDGGRFIRALRGVGGKRLDYRTLIGKNNDAESDTANGKDVAGEN